MDQLLELEGTDYGVRTPRYQEITPWSRASSLWSGPLCGLVFAAKLLTCVGIMHVYGCAFWGDEGSVDERRPGIVDHVLPLPRQNSAR